MASKVLVPTAPFAKLKVQKSPSDPPAGFIISADGAARVAHLEHSVRFLQDQHRLMLSGLHQEIEALRERNRDLQFQLIFNKESASKNSSPSADDKENAIAAENNKQQVESLKAEVVKLKHEAGAARSEARAAEAKAIQLQRLIDLQTEKLREHERRKPSCSGEHCESLDEARSELRARLADAERLVRRLRSDAEHQRRELQSMKNSLHAGLRATGIDYGYQQSYHFPAVHPEYFREEPLNLPGRNCRQSRRVLTLPELAGQQIPRATVYANHHTQPQVQPLQPRVNGYDKIKKPADLVHPHHPMPAALHDGTPATTPNDSLPRNVDLHITKSMLTYPELKIVIAKMIPHYNVTTGPEAMPPRPRPRRHHHRKHADHT